MRVRVRVNVKAEPCDEYTSEIGSKTGMERTRWAAPIVNRSVSICPPLSFFWKKNVYINLGMHIYVCVSARQIAGALSVRVCVSRYMRIRKARTLDARPF